MKTEGYVNPLSDRYVGGWLTANYSWRWVFYINLPFGLLAAAGLMIFLPGGGEQGRLRFDWLGFGMLTMGIGAMQLMLDRGQIQDWFTSREVIVEAVLAGLGFYLFLVHALSARQPLIRRRQTLLRHRETFYFFPMGQVGLQHPARYQKNDSDRDVVGDYIHEPSPCIGDVSG